LHRCAGNDISLTPRHSTQEGIEVRVGFAAGAVLFIALQAGLTITPTGVTPFGITFAYAADAIKPGRWEFTARMQMPAMPPGVSLPPGVSAPPGSGVNATHTGCIEPDKAVPTDPRPECKIDRMKRNGGTVSWATTCTTRQGSVRSQGVARYAGERMDGTLITQVPQANGRTMETKQQITGRYLGSCAK
jgi:hypothetical protein